MGSRKGLVALGSDVRQPEVGAGACAYADCLAWAQMTAQQGPSSMSPSPCRRPLKAILKAKACTGGHAARQLIAVRCMSAAQSCMWNNGIVLTKTQWGNH